MTLEIWQIEMIKEQLIEESHAPPDLTSASLCFDNQTVHWKSPTTTIAVQIETAVAEAKVMILDTGGTIQIVGPLQNEPMKMQTTGDKEKTPHSPPNPTEEANSKYRKK